MIPRGTRPYNPARTIGATILLVAIAATGLLLATNFSFANFYETFATTMGDRFVALRSMPERFRAWRQARREKRQQRIELKRQAKGSSGATANAIGITQAEGGTEIRSSNPELAEAFRSFSAATTSPP